MKPGIKICGLRDPEMAKQTVLLGARYIGILCHPESKRYVDLSLGHEIADVVRSANGIPVAVCVDHDAEEMMHVCERLNVDVVQCAGDVSRAAQVNLPNSIHRIYVCPVSSSGEIQTKATEALSALKTDRDFILFDGLESGSGRRFDLKGFSNPYPYPFFLAGGLRASNVLEAIEQVQPDFVDVSSGVEGMPGHKDLDKIKEFIAVVQGVQYEE